MGNSLNVFVLADGEVDFRDLDSHLALGGMVATCQRVKNAEEFNALLAVSIPDIVLVNADIEGVDVREVIHATYQRSPEIPVIVSAERIKRLGSRRTLDRSSRCS